MFHMEFRSTVLDAAEEDNEPSRTDSIEHEQSVDKQHLHGDSSPKIHEGRVGIFGKIQGLASTTQAVHTVERPPPIITRNSSPNDSVSKNWIEVDLIDLDSPNAEVALARETEDFIDKEVLRELVKPFAESVNLTHQPSGKCLDNDEFATPLDRQPRPVLDLLSNDAEVAEAASDLSRNIASLQERSSSMRSTASELSDTQSPRFHGNAGEKVHLKDEDKWNPATRAYNKALNLLMPKKNKPVVQEGKSPKPWEEPLLSSFEQAKVQLKLQKEAKAEAKRLADMAKKDAENKKRELLELADPVPESALKTYKDHGVRKGIQKLFHIHGGIHSPGHLAKDGHVDSRESKLGPQKVNMFETCISPGTGDLAISHMRAAPRPVVRKDIHFATVESNQRDVDAWTMEEYLAKNARQEPWEEKDDDEEFGGIEGHQLQDQYCNNDATGCSYDSDSD